MPTSTNVTNLKINELKEAQYDSAVQGGVIGANELSILTDATIDALPDQTGQSGKFLTTDGTDASWSDKPLVNTATGNLGFSTGSAVASGINSVALGNSATSTSNGGIAIGSRASATGFGSVAMGTDTVATQEGSVLIGTGTTQNNGCLIIGKSQAGFPQGSILLNATDVSTTTTGLLQNTFYVCVKYNNIAKKYEIMSADGTIPSDRLIHAINKYSTMPTAASTNLGWIVQFTGTTDSTYTHGHLYECVSDGQDPATYSWEEVQLGGGGSSYTAGTGIDITSGVISVTAPTLQNTATGTNSVAILGTATSLESVVIGSSASSSGQESVAVGKSSSAGDWATAVGKSSSAGGAYAVANGCSASSSSAYAIAIGGSAVVGSNANYAIQIGRGTNSDAGTLKIGTKYNDANVNYELMSADGTIPTARLTKVNTTITLTSAGWSSNTQTVNVTGITATGVVFVSPDPTDQSAYTSAGIYCTAQAAGTLTFTCDTVPSGDIDVNVVML